MPFGFGFTFKGGQSRSYTMTDADAIAFVNAIGDVPTNGATISATKAIDELVIALKAANTWSKAKAIYIAAPSLSEGSAEYNLVTATQDGTLDGTTTTGARGDMLSPYMTGYAFDSNDYFRCGVTPSTAFTLNSSCIMEGNIDSMSAGANYSAGSFNGTTQSLIFSPRFTGDVARGDMYNITAGAGRLNVSSQTETNGIWTVNRNASNYMEIVHDSTVVGTNTGNGGTLPTIEMFWGSYNSGGTSTSPKNGLRSFFAAFDGLSTAERAATVTAFENFNTTMGSRLNPTKQVIMEGNSHTRFQNEKLFRTIQYNLWNNGGEPDVYYYKNVGVSGQTVAQMYADYASQVAPLYNGSYTANDYLIYDASNGIYQGSTTADVKTDIANLCSAAQATGFRVVISLMSARTHSGNTGRTQTEFNLAMDEVNQWIRDNWQSWADAFVNLDDSNVWIWRADYASDAAYNTAIAALVGNTTYYTDETHLTEAGYKLIGDIYHRDAY